MPAFNFWPFKRVPSGATDRKALDFVAGGEDFARGKLRYLTTSEHDAKFSSVVMANVWWAMRNVKAAMPVVEADGSDGPVQNPNHPLTALLRAPQAGVLEEERSLLTGKRLLAVSVYSLMMDGNCYLPKLTGQSSGKVIGLDWVPSGAVKPVPVIGQPQVVDYYQISYGKEIRHVAKKDMIHLVSGLDPEMPCRGLSMLKAAMRQVMTDNYIAAYCEAISRKPSIGTIVTPRGGYQPTKDDATYIAEQMDAKSSGHKAGGTVVATFEADITPLNLSPDQMAISELNKMPEERICALFGIPPIVLNLGSADRSKYSNMKEAREAATEEFLVPFWDDWASTMTESLGPDFLLKPTERVAFDLTKVRPLTEDEDARHNRARQDFLANGINLAEFRQQIGQKPSTGDENVWAWMLKPSPAPPQGLPQGTGAGKAARVQTEGV